MAPVAIIGRAEELAAIARFFEDARPGSSALVLEGDAGIGKTTLWREAVRLAERTSLILSSRASEAEARMSFAVLGDLLTPVLEGPMAELPAGQRNALEAALLLGSPGPTRPDARAVSLAVLGVLRALASGAPLTIAVDDAQWIDAPSARALAFALRRLEDEPVTLVAATRSPTGASDLLDLMGSLRDGVDRLTIGPIARVPLGRLLRQRLEDDVASPLVQRIHEASGGNPFFALEIGRALEGADALLTPGEPLPVPADLRELLRRRLRALPRSTRDALLVAASSAQRTVPLVEKVKGSATGLAEAEDAGIVLVRGTSIEFTHPLFASTVYESASTGDRRAAHAGLANAVKDPEERARHLALCSTGPSEEVARVLEEAGDRAVARGAPLGATELYGLAATLTPPQEADSLQMRRLRSAQTLFAAGDTRGARELVEQILAETVPGLVRAQTMYSLSFMSWNDLPRVKGLLELAFEEIDGNGYIRGLILADLAWVELGACDPASALPWAKAAVELAEEVNDPFLLRSALAALASVEAVLGHDPADLLDRGISKEGSLAYGEVTTPRTCLGRFQLWKGALDAARDTLHVELERYLEQGHESASWDVRASLAEVEHRAGHWRLAADHALEAREIVLEAGWIDVLGEVAAVKAAIEAATGRVEEARDDGIEALAACERTGDRWNEIRARAALGFLEVSLGDAAAAHAWLAPATEMTERMDLREPGAFPFVSDEIEALVALGELEPAERLTDRLDDHGRALDRPLALATAARCRGLVAGARGDLEGAEAHLQRSLHEHSRTQHPLELGRTLLVGGSVRRRMRQKKGARDLLQQALMTFEELGAPLWSQRAQGELARIGGRAPFSTALTPTEAQIARLVAEGKTNREVAEALFVSVHTVEANLTRIYRKLDVRSRTELARKL
ncbi:MAG: AAA family ATPase [Actinomycetota bacterium]